MWRGLCTELDEESRPTPGQPHAEVVADLAAIAVTYGVEVDRATTAAIAATTAASSGGRILAGSLLKLLPGLGSAVGGAINGAVAATLTGSSDLRV